MPKHYVLYLDNGNQAHMNLIDDNITIEEEIKKFDSEKGILVSNNSLTGEQKFAKILRWELVKS